MIVIFRIGGYLLYVIDNISTGYSVKVTWQHQELNKIGLENRHFKITIDFIQIQ